MCTVDGRGGSWVVLEGGRDGPLNRYFSRVQQSKPYRGHRLISTMTITLAYRPEDYGASCTLTTGLASVEFLL